MDDAEQRNQANWGESAPSPKQEEAPSSDAESTSGRMPASAPPPSQAKVRRSSLRPAPADYVPSVRDPSKLRPMMVVRAGDLEPAEAHLPMAPGVIEQKTQPPPSTVSPSSAGASSAREPTANASAELTIPPAPPVPSDLLPQSSRPGFEQDYVAPGQDTSAPESNAAEAAAAKLVGHELTSTQAADSKPLAPSDAHVNSPSSKLAVAKQRRGPFLIVALIAVAVVGSVFSLRQRNASVMGADAEASARGAPPVPGAPSAVAAAQTRDQLEPNATTNEAAIALHSAAPTHAQEPEAAALDAVPPPPPETTRVRLEIKPVDAKVILRGREIPGPPYDFDLAKGQKIAVEVVRFGFVTAKVVIDDKKPVVNFGMLRARYKR